MAVNLTEPPILFSIGGIPSGCPDPFELHISLDFRSARSHSAILRRTRGTSPWQVKLPIRAVEASQIAPNNGMPNIM